MLRVIQNKSAASAKSYYTRGDYLSEGQELVGKWGGNIAPMLSLQGDVDKQSFDRLCDNLHPITGERLTQRTDSDRTTGYDFNFHLPKGASLAALVNGDNRIIPAFEEEVDETMREAEADMRGRVRKHGQNAERVTGSGIWGAFTHLTSRPEIDPDADAQQARVAAEPDPHVHRHCFMFNVTWDRAESEFKAGQFRELKRDASYYEAAFHARMSRRMRELGYDLARDGRDWDIAGISQATKEKFSRRTVHIEKLADELGVDDAREKDKLGARTRARKSSELTMPELTARWKDRLTPDEADALQNVADSVDRIQATESSLAHDYASVAYAKLHCFERESVLPKRKLLTVALRHGLGNVTVDGVRAQLQEQGIVTRELEGRVWATILEVVREEADMLNLARNGRNQAEPLNGDWTIKRDWLNQDQRHAVKHILSSRDTIIMTLGRAGTGKTTLLKEAVEAIEATGKKVYAFAPSAEASRGVLASEGFDATTVAELLVSKNLQQEVAGNVLLIDEAGLLGTRSLKRTLDLADHLNCRVLLSGDYKQHGSIERGSALRLLHHKAGIIPAEVREIQRQQESYKDAVERLAAGDTDEGLDRLQHMGWIQEIADDRARYLSFANEYAKSVEAHESVLAIAPTHGEADRVTAAIRQELRNRDLLSSDEREVMQLKPMRLTEAEKADPDRIRESDMVVFHQNAAGFRKGARVDPKQHDPGQLTKAAKQFEAYKRESVRVAPGDPVRITANGKSKEGKRLNNGSVYHLKSFTEQGDLVLSNGWTIPKDYGFVALGYVATSHASQGKTVDRVLISESALSYPAASREQIYVSLSRGRYAALIYTDDTSGLKDAVRRSTDSLTATELIADSRIELERRLKEAKSLAIAAKRQEMERHKAWEMVYER